VRIFATAIIAAILSFPSFAKAFNGVSVSIGVEYDPIAKLEYVGGNQPGLDIVDNFAWESGLFYHFPAGFRAGTFFSYYVKKIARGDTRSSDLSSWGIGILGDYGLEITESGRTLLVGGMEAGFGKLTDKNEFSDRSRGAVWVAGIGGIRYFFTRAFSVEMDYRMKWLQYDFTDEPRKNYDFSGSTLRLILEYGIYSHGH